MKRLPKITNPWPVGLVVFFILFIGYIAAFIVFACRQKMDLVRDDYYDQEIRFQQQIDRARRSAPVLANAGIEYDRAADAIKVSLPSVKQNDVSGTVTFYRPSDAALDNNVQLGLDAGGHQTVAAGTLCAGLWKVRVQWTAAGQVYFFEKPIVIERTARS